MWDFYYKYLFVELYDIVQVQWNTEVYSSFVVIYINPDITVYLIKVAWVE